MDKVVRFGIIGCGEIAAQTAQGIFDTPYAQLVAATDVNLALAQDLADRFGGKAVRTQEELLADPEVDAVYIAVPHYLHLPIAVATAEAGKPTLLEKPIALNIADGRRIIATFKEHNLPLGIAFNAQVDAVAQKVRQLIASGLIGRINGIRYATLANKQDSYWSGGYSGRVQTDWRRSLAKAGGGVLMMNLIHNLNTMRFITGLEVTRIYSEYGTYSTEAEVEDLIFATLRYDSGAIGSIEGGSAIRGGSAGAEDDRIYGTHGQIVLSYSSAKVFSTIGNDEFPANQWTPLGIEQKSQRYRIAEGFALALLNGKQPPVSGEDGLKALEIVEAAYRSGKYGVPIALPLD